MAHRTEHPISPLFHEPEIDDRSTHRHRVSIGLLGAALPPLIGVVAWLRPVDPSLSAPMVSISAYYYSGAVAFFAGILAALAVFLVTYAGFDNPDRWKDRVAALVGALAATAVAVFPGTAPAQRLVLPWWGPGMGILHGIATAVLFAAFIYFALVLFPKSSHAKEQLTSGKRLRNLVYRICGVVMIVCMVWVFFRARSQRQIFWLEAIALEAFALSWLVKGRADWTTRQLLRRARRPAQLAAQLLDLPPPSKTTRPSD